MIGVYSAIKRYSLFDNASTIFAYVGFAIPTFWLGSCRVHLPGRRILPVSGMVDIACRRLRQRRLLGVLRAAPIDAILDVSKHLILPVVTLVVVNIASDSRFVRASMIDLPEPGLRPDGQGQGPAGTDRDVQARAAERAAAGCDQHRPRDPVPVHGRDHHRDDLLVAGHRQAHDRRHDQFDYPVLMGSC